MMENIKREICQGNERKEDKIGQGAVISCPQWELLN